MGIKEGCSFTIGGIIHVDEDAKILGKVEIYADGEWILLPTDISSTKKDQIKVFVDADHPGETISLCFKSLMELEKIQAVRMTGMTIDRRRGDLLHIARNTISLEFDEYAGKDYGIAVKIQFPALLLKGEAFTELMKRNEEAFFSYDESLFFTYTSGNMAELDEYKKTKPIAKTYVPVEQAREVLEKQFDGIIDIFDAFGIRRWNYMERKRNYVCKPISDSKEVDLLKIPII